MSSGRGQYDRLDEQRGGAAIDSQEGHEVEEDQVQELHEGAQPTVVVVDSDDEEEHAQVGPLTPEAEDAITVKVKSTDEKNHDVRISATATVLQLKKVLESLTDYPSDRQRLISLGKLLVDEKTLAESNVKDGHFVHLVPKPAASVNRTDSSASRSGDRGNSDDHETIHIPPHIQQMFAARRYNSSNVNGIPVHVTIDESGSRFTYEDEYELNIWRYRVRVMSMLMLFYYFMSLMSGISLWLHPEDDDEYNRNAQFRQVKNDVALSLVDTLENVLGVTVSIVGLKTAISSAPALSKRFARELSTLCFVHFINLFMWIVALYRGEIIPNPPRHHTPGHNTTDSPEETVRSIVGALLIVHPLLWVTMLSIAFRYHKILTYRDDVLNPPEATPAPANTDGSSTVPPTAQVV